MKSVDISLQRYLFPNINEDGWKFISVLAFLTVILAMIWLPLGLISLAVTIWCFYCFRDPVRVTPVLSDAVVAPADGFIVSITREKGPDALGLNNKNYTRICIFTGLFDAQINRIPIKGKISKTFYDAGKPFCGSLDKNDIGAERAMFVLRNPNNLDFVVQQTAVFCSKRIVNRYHSNDEFLAGQRFGFIRGGGYVDLFLPDKIEPLVCVGQRTVAGETIITDIKSDAPRIEGEIR
ncbi:MAG: phosphatidylserine decarboxylase [Alphaproteobacteria bacterium]|nr:phosphatidylserine decarboxylase [Alphaproteobacteria bacterium]